MAAGGTAASCRSDGTACWRHSPGCDEPQRSHSQPHSDWSGRSHGVPMLSVTDVTSLHTTQHTRMLNYVKQKVPCAHGQPPKVSSCQHTSSCTMNILNIWAGDGSFVDISPCRVICKHSLFSVVTYAWEKWRYAMMPGSLVFSHDHFAWSSTGHHTVLGNVSGQWEDYVSRRNYSAAMLEELARQGWSYLTNINYKLTYLLTPWSIVLLEKLTGSAPSQETPRTLWNLKVHHRIHKCLPSVPILSQLQSPTPPTSRRSILILSSHLHLSLPNGLFPSGFPTRTLCTPLPSTQYAPHAPPISFFLILPPAQYWVRSKDP